MQVQLRIKKEELSSLCCMRSKAHLYCWNTCYIYRLQGGQEVSVRNLKLTYNNTNLKNKNDQTSFIEHNLDVPKIFVPTA